MSQGPAERPGGAPGWDELVIVADGLRAHGVRGEVIARDVSGDPAQLLTLQKLYFGHGPHDLRAMTIRSARPTFGGVILRFDGVETREAAAAIAGGYLLIPLSETPKLPPGRAYTFQLPGLRVEAPDGRDLGRIVDVEECPANDVWVARCEDGEYRIPAIDSIVLRVDVPAGVVVIDPIPGLLPEPPRADGEGRGTPRR